FDAVELALEQLEQSTNRAASRRAWAMLESGDFPPSQEHKKGRDRRWKRAILRLRAQGAIVKQAESDKLGKEIIDVPAEENPLPIVILAESWKGGAAGLVDIKRMSARFPLPIVYVVAEAANIPADRIDDLQRARPRMKIENRGAAMLGISGNADSPCRVTRVEPNSAAAKAGILENDMIVKYDGEELSNFEQLIKITKRHKVGDKIEIEVNRDGTKINVEAQLTGWTLSKPATEMK
ncbi:MAG TPA: PDZ domain-containing protein, partial [Planctomycetaceae bacterium]|nr:PDZ domain-containing protein [Planctomycetaceae bacterium]